jgi:hypothetical protein
MPQLGNHDYHTRNTEHAERFHGNHTDRRNSKLILLPQFQYRFILFSTIGGTLISLFASFSKEYWSMGMTSGTLLIAGTFLLASSIFSRQISGPLYKLLTSMKKTSQGEYVEDINFRGASYFNELSDEFNIHKNAISQLRESTSSHSKEDEKVTEVFKKAA